MSGGRQLSVWTVFVAWAAMVAATGLYGYFHGSPVHGGRAYFCTLGILAFYLGVMLLLAADNLGERLARRLGFPAGILFSLTPYFAYLIYLFGTGTFSWWRAGIAAAYVFTPAALAIAAGSAKPGAWQDYAAMLAIFLPLKARWLGGFWPYQGNVAELGAHFGSVATMLLAVSVALGTFLFVRRLDGVGYTLVRGSDTAFSVVIHFVLLAAIVIPLGAALHFIRFDPSVAHWKSLPMDALAIFLLTAWPEELLFRGLLQNCLSKSISSPIGGWIAASVVFGIAHITNNGVFPNWRYALLAAIAGLFYGSAWRRTGSILPAALVHALVDTAWHLLFRTI